MKQVLALALIFTSFSLIAEDQQGLPPVTTYDPAPVHLWNRLHQTLFTRTLPDGHHEIHTALRTLDPLIFPDSNYLFEGTLNRNTLAVLDEFLNTHGENLINDPARRLILQHDLWAAFDSLAWVVGGSYHLAKNEPAAIALRTRLAKIIKRLAFSDKDRSAVPDNFAAAAKANAFQAAYDQANPKTPFFPADLFDENGPWVRYHNTGSAPAAIRHVESVGGRSVFLLFMRLPAGRDATLSYLRGLKEKSFNQFPEGTMVAMVRRALVVDTQSRIRLSPVTEAVQIRVYRTINPDPNAVMTVGHPGIQDTNEFMLDRADFFSGKPGLTPLQPGDPGVGFGPNRADGAVHDPLPGFPAFKTYVTNGGACVSCHQQPGIYSVMNIANNFRSKVSGKAEHFYSLKTYDLETDVRHTVDWKYKLFDWGLLQGLLEAQ